MKALYLLSLFSLTEAASFTITLPRDDNNRYPLFYDRGENSLDFTGHCTIEEGPISFCFSYHSILENYHSEPKCMKVEESKNCRFHLGKLVKGDYELSTWNEQNSQVVTKNLFHLIETSRILMLDYSFKRIERWHVIGNWDKFRCERKTHIHGFDVARILHSWELVVWVNFPFYKNVQLNVTGATCVLSIRGNIAQSLNLPIDKILFGEMIDADPNSFFIYNDLETVVSAKMFDKDLKVVALVPPYAEPPAGAISAWNAKQQFYCNDASQLKVCSTFFSIFQESWKYDDTYLRIHPERLIFPDHLPKMPYGEILPLQIPLDRVALSSHPIILAHLDVFLECVRVCNIVGDSSLDYFVDHEIKQLEISNDSNFYSLLVCKNSYGALANSKCQASHVAYENKKVQLFLDAPQQFSVFNLFTYDERIKTLFNSKSLSIDSEVRIEPFKFASCTRVINTPTIIATLYSSISNYLNLVDDLIIPIKMAAEANGGVKPLLFLSLRDPKEVGRHHIDGFSNAKKSLLGVLKSYVANGKIYSRDTLDFFQGSTCFTSLQIGLDVTESSLNLPLALPANNGILNVRDVAFDDQVVTMIKRMSFRYAELASEASLQVLGYIPKGYRSESVIRVTIIAHEDRFGNFEDLIEGISKFGVAPLVIRVLDYNFNELVEIFSKTNILIASPTSALSYMMFMPKGSVLIQLLPQKIHGLKLIGANLALMFGHHSLVATAKFVKDKLMGWTPETALLQTESLNTHGQVHLSKSTISTVLTTAFQFAKENASSDFPKYIET